MPEPAHAPPPLSLQSAQVFRYVLAGLFALLIFGGAPTDSRLPFSPQMAHADGISSVPGYACAMMKQNSRFYLVDTYEKRICVYALQGDGLRLVSARRFSQDEQVFDSSIKAPISIEAGGATVEQTEQYVNKAEKEVKAIKHKAGKD